MIATLQRKYTYTTLFILSFLLTLSGQTSMSDKRSDAFSQMVKGDKYFANDEYSKAILCYKKVTKSKNLTDREAAYVKLASTYKKVNQYQSAEDSYRLYMENNPEPDKEVVFDYAQILKANGKYEEAYEQYTNYVTKNPNDVSAKKALKFCKEIKYYMSRPNEYAVSNVASINTERAEFSPFVSNNQLLFIAEREQFDFVNYSVDNNTGEPYSDIYISDIKGTVVTKSKEFSKKINSDFHDASGCLTTDGKTIYFSHVESVQKKGYVSRSKICSAKYSKKGWADIKEINLCSNDYSIAHPSISEDGNTLYFTSDMPGGNGGKDLYMSTNTGGSWSTPINLGKDINTSGDEMFPTIRKDGSLWFSSNGLPGFGGLDIYTAKKMDDIWILNRNEGLELNSGNDDFGVTFINDSIGYFSSNRQGGKGNDDIYRFTFTNKSTTVSGKVLLTENFRDPAKSKKVVLLDELGNLIDSMYTDSKGFFVFKNLPSDKRYMASIQEDDPELIGKARYYLAENDTVIHRVTASYKDSRFVFRNLPVDPSALPDLYTEDELVFAGTLRAGNKTAPLANVKLRLVNDYGDVVEEATTNEYGAFAFRNIPANQNYMIAMDDGDVKLDEGTKIILTNKAGKDVRTFYKGKDNFSFKVLTVDETLLEDMDAEDVNLVMGIYGFIYDQDKKPIVNAKIKVREEDGTNAKEWVTSKNGKFNFKNLDAEKNYIIEADANDSSLKDVKRIYIADSKGRIYKVVDLMSGKFSFKILEVDKFSMGEFVVDEPNLLIAELKKNPKGKKRIKEGKEFKEEEAKEATAAASAAEEAASPDEESQMTVTIVENIYYAYGDYSIGEEGKSVLDKAADALEDYPKLMLEISSHTDSQSSSEFNLGLSKRRAQTAVDYLVKKGISRARLKATGYGETRLLNRCNNDVECTDEEHKVNRRTEFKITKPINK
jgi:outer membrane protein OmpA-like peptidoglycan-associated protein